MYARIVRCCSCDDIKDDEVEMYIQYAVAIVRLRFLFQPCASGLPFHQELRIGQESTIHVVVSLTNGRTRVIWNDVCKSCKLVFIQRFMTYHCLRMDSKKPALTNRSHSSQPKRFLIQATRSSTFPALAVTALLFNLELINLWRELGQYLISSLVIFQLCSNQVGQVTEWLGGIQDLNSVSYRHQRKRSSPYVLHDTLCFFNL